MAVSGSTILFGTGKDYNENDANVGSVYIFDTTGQFITKLIAPDGRKDDKFGFSVAVDGSAIVAGASGDNGNGATSGSVYLFDSIRTFKSKVLVPDGAADDSFGWSVAISGSTFVVCSKNFDDNGDNSGSAYVFDTTGNFVTKLTAEDGAAGDPFDGQ